MGIFDGWKRKQKVKEAAKQLWNVIRRGHNIEVPLLLDKNDLTMEAVTELQKEHPQAQLRLYQSRGMVLGLFRSESLRGNPGISDGTLNQFTAAGHIGGGFREMKPEDLLAGQEAFLRAQGLDPELMEKEAQAERAKRDRIEVGSANVVETAAQEALKQKALDEKLGDGDMLVELKALTPAEREALHSSDAVALSPNGTAPLDAPSGDPHEAGQH